MAGKSEASSRPGSSVPGRPAAAAAALLVCMGFESPVRDVKAVTSSALKRRLAERTAPGCRGPPAAAAAASLAVCAASLAVLHRLWVPQGTQDPSHRAGSSPRRRPRTWFHTGSLQAAISALIEIISDQLGMQRATCDSKPFFPKIDSAARQVGAPSAIRASNP